MFLVKDSDRKQNLTVFSNKSNELNTMIRECWKNTLNTGLSDKHKQAVNTFSLHTQTMDFDKGICIKWKTYFIVRK